MGATVGGIIAVQDKYVLMGVIAQVTMTST